jgi:hypothetical protein
MRRIFPVLLMILGFNYCATTMYKTDIGEASMETLDAGRGVIGGLAGGVSYPREYDYAKPGNLNSSYTKRQFYTEVAPSGYDFDLLDLLIGSEAPVAYKFVSAEPRGMGNRSYYLNLSTEDLNNPREISIAYLSKPVVKAHFESDKLVSLSVIDKKGGVNPHLMRGVYHAAAGSSSIIDKFSTADGYEGYYIRYKAAKTPEQGIAYLLVESKEKFIFVRVNTLNQKRDMNKIVAVPGAIARSLEKQIALYISASQSIKSPCESKIGKKTQDECFAAEAAEVQKRRETYSGTAAPHVKQEQFCTTIYGTPKDGIQSNVTRCFYK